MAAGLIGLGFWAPPTVRRNDEWPPSFTESFRRHREARRARDVTDVERRAPERPFEDLFLRYALPFDEDPFKGTVERRVAAPGASIVDGDAAAARQALEDARVHPLDVDLVLSSAVLQEKLVPSNGPAIQDLVGCKRAAAIGVEAYCSAPLAHLDLAAGVVASGAARYVLCVQSHQLSHINPFELPHSPVFGDAASAFVVGTVPDGRGLVRVVRGGDGSLRNAVNHGYRDTPGATWWKDAAGPILAAGIDDPVAMRTIARNTLAYPVETIGRLLAEARVPVDAVAAVATIQPLAWYPRALADALGIPPDRVPTTYERYAHIGGAAIVANLLAARERGLLRDGAPVVLYAHGAGLTRYGALLRV
jgi:3-oxoacyl-[acyl-carrier-protein] synthase-3